MKFGVSWWSVACTRPTCSLGVISVEAVHQKKQKYTDTRRGETKRSKKREAEQRKCELCEDGWEICGNVESAVIMGLQSVVGSDIREVLQNEFRYDFRKCPREISAGTVFTVFTCIIAFNTVITVPAEISRGHFRKSYRNSFCKTSLLGYIHGPKRIAIYIVFAVFVFPRKSLFFVNSTGDQHQPECVETML